MVYLELPEMLYIYWDNPIFVQHNIYVYIDQIS